MPRFRPVRAALAAALLAWPAGAAAQSAAPLTTRPERTDWRETSRYADVVAFLEEVAARSPRIHLTTFGYTNEGRALPLAVVGNVEDPSPAAVRASGKAVVYLQGNIHAGEVEGKEVLQALLREVAGGSHPAWGDSLVLLVAPIYNADGNERVALGNRPFQHGPVGGMGQRPNAQGLDLNRDHVKVDAPETRSLLALLREYDPHVLVDLHTTNGTFHAYHLTYAPPLHPSTDAAIDGLLRREWLPAVTRRLRREGGWLLHEYGNVPAPESRWAAAEGAERAWYTFDHRPRFGTNYAGLRNRFAILSEAFSYLPFRQRAEVTERFTEGLLDWAAANASRIRAATAAADARPVAGTELAVRARLRRSGPAEVLMGAVDTVAHPYTGEPMYRRRDVVRPEQMPLYVSFEPAETERAPAAWLVPPSPALAQVADRLAAHGVRFERMEAAGRMRVEEFAIDSTRVAEQPFQGRHERTVWGRWRAVERELAAGTLRVPADQPLGRLAFTLLEPRSDDGLLAWGLLDAALDGAAAYPLLREPAPGR